MQQLAWRWEPLELPIQRQCSALPPRSQEEASAAVASLSPGAVSILVSPLEDLIGVDSVLPCNTRNRRTRHKRRLDNPTLLFSGAMNPFRATCGNFTRLAHKAFVGQIMKSVYTARTGRLRSNRLPPNR